MNLKVGNLYYGFILQDERSIDEIDSKAYMFCHEKSGARLMYIANNDDNKVFSITFRTPPADNTGVAHIIEHSVLCGSRKYPLKEPFVELVKGSLNTYLNAMTFADKTMYPVASRNDKDFRNLMDVYLDAVFFPRIYKTPEILMQEGWHYHLEDPSGEMTYKGVVYNEMKGVFSSPDAVLLKESLEVLYPDTCYGFDSGGDPDHIPELTQEDFLEFHRRYYHPANSYIYLYGDMDVHDCLKHLDEGYLSEFDRIYPDSEIALQAAFDRPVEYTGEYSISPAETTADKSFLSKNYVIGQAGDPELYLAMQILEYLLVETPAAPLKEALIKKGIGKDAFGYFNKSMLQPMLTIGVAGANAEQLGSFNDLVDDTLAQLVQQGIDKKMIEAAINVFEFALREADFGQRPKGLVYNIRIMDTWLYDQDPYINLCYEKTLEKIKGALNNGYFESIIEKYLLNNKHQAIVALKPVPGLAEKKNEIANKQLSEYKKNLSPQQVQEIVDQTKRLKEMQTGVDSEQDLQAIPLLDIKDIEPNIERLPLSEEQAEGIPVLLHPMPANNIVYTTMYFDMRAVPYRLIPYAYLLAEVLGKVDTENYTYGDLSNEININTGGISYQVVAYDYGGDDANYLPKFRIKVKNLAGKMPEAIRLLGEIAGKSKYDNVARLKEIINQVKAYWEVNVFRNGQQIVANRAMAYFSPLAVFNEMGLLSFYHFIAELDSNFDSMADQISAKLSKVASLIFNQDNLLVSLVLDKENYPPFKQAFSQFPSYLGHDKLPRQTYQFTPERLNEGLMTAGKVQYVAKAANFKRLGYKYHGSMRVLETILRYDYLWNTVRVQGGAYGAFARFERNGNMVFGSYRDPNLVETLAIYDQTAEYLRNFAVNEREMRKYIIGTISQMDTPLTPQQKGERAAVNYIKGITPAQLKQERDEVLNASQTDINNLADLVADAMKQNYLCVLGGEQKIKAHKAVFNNLVEVFK